MLLALLVGGALWSHLSIPELVIISEGKMEDGCSLQQGGCQVELPGLGMVSLVLSPTPIRVMQPFTAQLSTTGFAAEQVVIRVTGINMEMGRNTFRMLADSEYSHSATLLLPICTLSDMQWQFEVLLQQPKGSARVLFLLET